MRRFLKIAAWSFGAVVLIIVLGLVYLRETLGGAYLNKYFSPKHPEYMVEVYVREGLIGAPEMSLFVVDRGHRHYLGEIELDMDAEWSPWTDHLTWSTDGAALFCLSSGPEAVYVFGEQRALVVGNERVVAGTPFRKAATLAEFDSVLAQHGEGGEAFFTGWSENPGSFIWRDRLPPLDY